MTQDSLGVPHDIKAKRHDPSLLPSSPWLLTQPPPPHYPHPNTHMHTSPTPIPTYPHIHQGRWRIKRGKVESETY